MSRRKQSDRISHRWPAVAPAAVAMAALLGSASVVRAQASYTIQGTVLGLQSDGVTKKPLAGAQVFFNFEHPVKTNSAGAYKAVNLDAGRYVVRAVASGYVFSDKAVTLPTSGIRSRPMLW